MYTYRLVFMKDGSMESVDLESVEAISAAGFQVSGMETGQPGTWLSGQEYPKISGFIGGLREEKGIIRYETREVYNILGN